MEDTSEYNRNLRASDHLNIALLAHVDAGKTTLSEAMLYTAGQIRSLGRVDHRDAYLDHDIQERERGITIFSKQARIQDDDWQLTLLDTPGHVDFSAEMERTLQVLDYAVLVISGTDGVQGHTRTLWRLLSHYQVPAFLFVNKMDLDGADRARIAAELRHELSDGCVDFSCVCSQRTGGVPSESGQGEEGGTEVDLTEFYEELAVCAESLLNEYMETDSISTEAIRQAIEARQVFPCFYGSALKLEGISAFMAALKKYTKRRLYPEEFSARVYKIGRDPRGARLTYMKITGGSLSVKDTVEYTSRAMGKRSDSGEISGAGGRMSARYQEKIDQIRLYSGDRYETKDTAEAGEVCAVTGLTGTFPGLGIGAREETGMPVLEPVLTFRIFPPREVSPAEMMGMLRELEEEDPQLHIVWDERLQEIHVQMMGQVQVEVLTRLIRERFGVAVVFGPGNIVYKETIAKPVEGVGHFEPLRHYAEVHILLEPGEPGSGIQVGSACSEDVLDVNWQRLIATHLVEREHPGVLTGSVVTDVKFTILTGRAHIKHTVGGDFRQATYRAVRQGLKSTKNILLEPYNSFCLHIPMEYVGRAMTDLEQRFASMDAPEFLSENGRDFACIRGRAPVAAIQDYIGEVHAYTSGLGHLQLELCGYDVCRNAEEVIGRIGYDSEEDVANPAGSVFCAHGAGFLVPWDEVPNYMHLPYVYRSGEAGARQADGFSYDGSNAFGADSFAGSGAGKKSWSQNISSMSSYELDAELQDVYAREFGMSRDDVKEQERRKWTKEREGQPRANSVKYDKKGNPIYPAKKPQEDYLIVDGYNIIFAWEELASLAKINMDSARDRLKDILSNYQGYRRCRLLLVFDAYKTKGNPGTKERYHNIDVVYTRQDETADMYIERKAHELRNQYRVTVATSDGMEQLTVSSMGALRMSAGNLWEDIGRVSREGYEEYIRNRDG